MSTFELWGKQWETDGLPEHMVAGFPLTVEIEVARNVTEMADGSFRYQGTATLATNTHTVQLERDGVPLTMADKLPGWVAGERDGWLKR